MGWRKLSSVGVAGAVAAFVLSAALPASASLPGEYYSLSSAPGTQARCRCAAGLSLERQAGRGDGLPIVRPVRSVKSKAAETRDHSKFSSSKWKLGFLNRLPSL